MSIEQQEAWWKDENDTGDENSANHGGRGENENTFPSNRGVVVRSHGYGWSRLYTPPPGELYRENEGNQEQKELPISNNGFGAGTWDFEQLKRWWENHKPDDK